jgi:hypothetical protein
MTRCSLAALLLLLANASVFAVGCGGASKPVAATNASAPVSDTSSAVSTATTTPPPASTAPELIFCQEEPGSLVIQLAALSGGPEGVTVTPLSTFSNVLEKTCNVSPDLTKLAQLSETSDGSKLAGYLPAGGGFVNLSGHDSNSYSDTPVTDESLLFNPATGELWWTTAGQIWSSAVNGGTPEYHGTGLVGAFSAASEPLPYPVSTSPDKSIGVIEKQLEELSGQSGSGLGLAIGKPGALDAACQDRTVHGNEIPAVSTLVSQCPGVANVVLPETTCKFFIGFVSASAFVCQTDKDGNESFDRLTFTIEGRRVKIVSDVPLTPPTQMYLDVAHEAAQVAPDGQTLWYTATRRATPTESSEQTSLYVIPTGTPTAEPAPVSLTPETAVTASTEMAGWRWHGKFLPSH